MRSDRRRTGGAAGQAPGHDGIHRELGDIARHHDQAMRLLDRRRLLTAGGMTIAATTAMAACGETRSKAKSAKETPGGASSAAGAHGSADSDVSILRTASSVEVLLVQTYRQVITMGLISDSATAAAAESFMEQHDQHSQAFQQDTSEAGGTPYDKPNAVFNAQVVAPAVALLHTEHDALMLAYTLETVASQTCQSTVGRFYDTTYNTTVASVLGVESRHQTLIGLLLNAPTMPAFPAGGFQAITNAVRFGVGI